METNFISVAPAGFVRELLVKLGNISKLHQFLDRTKEMPFKCAAQQLIIPRLNACPISYVRIHEIDLLACKYRASE